MTPDHAATGRLPIYYTFGNHMHWVNMEWLWGEEALRASVRDMLRYCAETGARGNINFDAIGYEKLAAEAPDALAELQAAVKHGEIEVVGASYGQPYGLFHGGESNVRQRVYGVRTVKRLLGVRPRTFWEEEFDFFPQLPQLLRGVGMEYASLFFQWTWHTPTIPQEDVPAVWWEGLDGSRLLTATRNTLNLHQWPEDVLTLTRQASLCEGAVRGLVQWLELLPSPDWMCRAELMVPPLRRLIESTDCTVRFATLSEYLRAAEAGAPVRRYSLDHVFHGTSLGKNGDLFRRLSRKGEQCLLAAETLAAVAGLFGRPYASWDVYPGWELAEAWRQLMAGQHHDNDECEGLCGHVGRQLYARSLGLAGHVAQRTLSLLAERTSGPAGRTVAFNPLGWPRAITWHDPAAGRSYVADAIPAFGCAVIEPATCRSVEPVRVEESGATVTLIRNALSVTVDRRRGVIAQITSQEFPDGVLRADLPLADLQMIRHGEIERFAQAEVSLTGAPEEPGIRIVRRGHGGAEVGVSVTLAGEVPAVDLHYATRELPRPDGGVASALRTFVSANVAEPQLFHDHPYGVSEIQAQGTYTRKYPTGDWMTSPQVYEEIRGPFTALQMVDIVAGERGLLYLHDGSQAFQRDGDTLHHILSLYDPWDEDYFVSSLDAHVRLVPHGPLSHAERWRMAQEFTRPALIVTARLAGGDLPAQWSLFECQAPGVVMTALYREPESAGDGFAEYAGRGVGFPYVLRLVELNGDACSARIIMPGPVAAAYRTNLLGERLATLIATPLPPREVPAPGRPTPWQLNLALRPHEVVTIYLDLEPGRKEARKLDERRSIWATAHRVDME